MNKHVLTWVAALLSLPAFASDPASHDVTLEAAAGSTVTVEWEGSALPGGSGAGSAGGLATVAGAPDMSQPCLAGGPDDSHAVKLTLPAGIYDSFDVTADFHVEWEEGTTTADLVTDPDLVLSVFGPDGDELGSSDGGDPSENVRVSNPAAGEFTAMVCPFSASKPTPYHGKLTLTVTPKASCIMAPTAAVAHSTAVSKAGLKDRELSGWMNFDIFRSEVAARAAARVPKNLQGRLQSSQYDRALGKPTFLWARTDAKAAAVGALASGREVLIARARAHLRDEAKQLQLSEKLIDEAQAFDAQYNGKGPAVVRFRQYAGGIEVFHRSLNVVLSRADKPVAVSGYFATDYNPGSLASAGFLLGAPQAIAAAWSNLGGAVDASLLTLKKSKGAWQLYSTPKLAGNYAFEREPRVKKVYYPGNGKLEPAWFVELFMQNKNRGGLLAHAFVVSATSGRVLHRSNLKADAAWTYRVFAEPDGIHEVYDSPLGNGYTPFPGTLSTDKLPRVGVSTNLVTLEHGPISTGDPWLADDATDTVGNNVDACLDHFDNPADNIASTPLNTCDPILGDIRPAPSGDHTFDYDVAADEDPSHENAVNAAGVSMFYINNWLHDWWYDHGFNEEAGNAQTSNYGRGGEEGDAIKAQAQDASGRNNANMSTPSDGSAPTMQQYLFDGPLIGEVRVTAPADSGPLTWSAFNDIGPTSYDVSGDVVLASDGMGEADSDGCGMAVPAGLPVPPGIPALPQLSLAGKIALIDRGGCAFTTKEQFAELSGAVAMIVVNNADGDPPSSVGNVDVPVVPVQPTAPAYIIPAVFIRKDAGQVIKDQLAAGAVTAHLVREASADVDGTLDNQIVSHEFFHYVHHRLTDSSNNQSGSMSEGWGDVDAMMISVAPDDLSVVSNVGWSGAYGLAGYVVNNFFAGIRRAPYSTNPKLNGFTLKHIADGEPTPDGGAGATNSEVHAAGEIWANEMWNCYAGILNDERHSYQEARDRMQDYIIAGLKMTPADATYTEARDAILSAVLATDFQDYAECSHGFARLGSGLNAVSPPRDSTDHVGVVEDYTEFVCPNSTAPGEPAEPPVIAEAVAPRSRFGGALGFGLLLPLLGLGALRRRQRR